MMEGELLIPFAYSKEISISIMSFITMSIILNVWSLWRIYKKRSLRNSSTAIIVSNLACVDILVTLKDLPMFYKVSTTGEWFFDETWCASYGLTNVMFIIVSVSTLVTITTEKFARTKEMDQANNNNNTQVSQRPLVLGYVIAHTTLSYSLSLLWSKYIFVTRKTFCTIEWPPHHAFSITFLSSFIFILPVSILIYNLLYKNLFSEEEKVQSKTDLECGPNENAMNSDRKAQNQLSAAIALFMISWTPYVIESLVSSFLPVSPIVGTATACVPLLTTSLLPFIYVKFLAAKLESRRADALPHLTKTHILQKI